MIRVLGGTRRRYAGLGDVVIVAVKDALPNGTVKKSDVARGGGRAHGEGDAPQGRQLHPLRRERRRDHQRAGEPRATRIFGPVARELREKKYMKIVSLAPEVI